jgi:hypothetical protein
VLGDGADLLSRRWHGDLRRLRDQAGGDPGMTEALLAGFPGLGGAGAGIFLREAQAVWPVVAPYVDAPMTSGARRVGLPDSRSSLAALLSGSGQPARLAAAPVRGVGEPARSQRGHRCGAGLIQQFRTQSCSAEQFLTESCPTESSA